MHLTPLFDLLPRYPKCAGHRGEVVRVWLFADFEGAVEESAIFNVVLTLSQSRRVCHAVGFAVLISGERLSRAESLQFKYVLELLLIPTVQQPRHRWQSLVETADVG